MGLLRRAIFIGAHTLMEPKFYSTYKMLVKNQWKSYEEHKKQQEKQLRAMIQFAYRNVPYYHELFKTLNLKPDDIRTIEDLEKLPILTKDIIRKNWDKFKPVNLRRIRYTIQSTGGSTGQPLRYRLSQYDRFLGVALMYRGWGYGGYRLGDKLFYFGGSALIPSLSSTLKIKLHEITRNTRFISSFDLNDETLKMYTFEFNKSKPAFLRGYASSIYFWAKWIIENGIQIHTPNAIFTTAEKLFPHMRKTISEAFGCDVYNNYGLNDGGVSAYECSEHQGLHIDTERSIMEIVDSNGEQIEEGEGMILATSLHNYAMPFIRYNTGDVGYLISDKCNCGRGYKLLKDILGRQQEFLITPEGKYIHGEFISHIFWEIEGVKEFQVIQDAVDHILIQLNVEDNFDESQLKKIEEIIKLRAPGWNVEFKFVDSIKRTKAEKYRFVVNKLLFK